MPQLLQSLDSYDATTAGMVLTPGALVIVVMAPFIVRLTPIVGAKRLICIGFFFLAVAVWHVGHLALNADYGVFARARMLQGFGLGFLIVPITQVAYSYLPPEKNNKASSLTNLFRNEGGSFGITFANTMLAQRAQFHQSVLAQHLTPGQLGLSRMAAAHGRHFYACRVFRHRGRQPGAGSTLRPIESASFIALLP